MARGGYFVNIDDDAPAAARPGPLEAGASKRLLIAAPIDAILFFSLWLLRWDFEVSKVTHESIGDYAVESSVFDLSLLLVIRVVFAILITKLTIIIPVGKWIFFWCAVLAAVKLLTVTFWQEPVPVGVCLSSIGFSIFDYLNSRKREKPIVDSKEQKKKKSNIASLLRIFKSYFLPDGMLNRARVCATWLFLGLSKVCNIVAPLQIAKAVQMITQDGEVPTRPVIMFCTLVLFSKLFKELQSVVYLKVKQTAFAEVATYTFQHLHTLSLEWHLKKKMGQVLRAMDRGIAAADNVMNYVFLNLVPNIVECFITFAIFWAHFGLPRLAAMATLAFVLYCWCTVIITIWRKKFREQTNRHDNDFHDKATDSLVNYETVKYFTNEDYESNSYADSIQKYQKFSVATQATLSGLNSVQSLIIQSTLCAGLLITSHAIKEGKLEVGDFVAVQVYVTNLFGPLTYLGMIYGMLIQAFVDMNNLSEMLAESPDVVDQPDAKDLVRVVSKGVDLAFNGVGFHYTEQPPENGLQNVSFDVPAKTTTAIVGHTGAGKTTISRLLFRFYDVKSGSITLDGQSIADVTQKSLRKAIGIVPQDTVLFNDSILHNIKYGNLDATMEQIEEAAQAAQILDFIQNLPKGWDTKVGERGLKLSGGEKQRVAIARCLLKDPSLVLLDEATSALDTKTEKDIQAALQCLKGRTTMIIAHRLSTVRGADQIVVMGKGKVLEKGTHEQLMEAKGEYYAMWMAQLDDDSYPGSPVNAPLQEEGPSKAA